MASRVTPNAESNSSCVFHGSSLRNASNSASPEVFGLPSSGQSSNRNHCLWSDGTNHGTLFHLEQHLRKLFGALDALQPPFSSNERRKSTLPANNDYFAQNQTFSHNQKYMAQNKITNVSKRFVYHMSELGSWRFG